MPGRGGGESEGEREGRAGQLKFLRTCWHDAQAGFPAQDLLNGDQLQAAEGREPKHALQVALQSLGVAQRLYVDVQRGGRGGGQRRRGALRQRRPRGQGDGGGRGLAVVVAVRSGAGRSAWAVLGPVALAPAAEAGAAAPGFPALHKLGAIAHLPQPLRLPAPAARAAAGRGVPRRPVLGAAAALLRGVKWREWGQNSVIYLVERQDLPINACGRRFNPPSCRCGRSCCPTQS